MCYFYFKSGKSYYWMDEKKYLYGEVLFNLNKQY